MFVFNYGPPEDGKFLPWMSGAKYSISLRLKKEGLNNGTKTFMLSFFFSDVTFLKLFFLHWPIISSIYKIMFVYVLIR